MSILGDSEWNVARPVRIDGTPMPKCPLPFVYSGRQRVWVTLLGSSPCPSTRIVRSRSVTNPTTRLSSWHDHRSDVVFLNGSGGLENGVARFEHDHSRHSIPFEALAAPTRTPSRSVSRSRPTLPDHSGAVEASRHVTLEPVLTALIRTPRKSRAKKCVRESSIARTTVVAGAQLAVAVTRGNRLKVIGWTA